VAALGDHRCIGDGLGSAGGRRFAVPARMSSARL
jgi:hypothetical protein